MSKVHIPVPWNEAETYDITTYRDMAGPMMGMCFATDIEKVAVALLHLRKATSLVVHTVRDDLF